MLLGPNGQPISTTMFKKAEPPKTGPAFGAWAGRDNQFFGLPGGAILQFDLSALTLDDYQAMRYHPQINANLSVLTFMIHQIDWWIDGEDKKQAEAIENNLREIWTRLVRALSQAFWSGFSPNVLEYENNSDAGDPLKIKIVKVKDLPPQECEVKWKEVEAWAPAGQIPPKLKIYDGIKQRGYPIPIPVDNSLWYPLLMENGDHYGRKLLKAAFTPWYFSILVHLFANRYYERFGEPTPVGRAPFDNVISMGDGTTKTGKEFLETVMMNLRNRSVVALPSERDPVTKEYDWTLEYMESQMRGADFERYLTRLDEEISLALFTPLLLLRNADVGSHNLGVQHTQTWLWMLNALAGDMKEYIDRYIVNRLKAINFSPKAPRIEWKFRKMGKESTETMRGIITQLIGKDKATVDLEELGMQLGMTVKQVRQVDPSPANDPNQPAGDIRDRSTRDKPNPRKGVGEPRATGREVSNRVRSQVENAWNSGKFGPNWTPDFGYRRRMIDAFTAEGFSSDEATKAADAVFDGLKLWAREAASLGTQEFSGPADFMALFDRALDNEIDRAAA